MVKKMKHRLVLVLMLLVCVFVITPGYAVAQITLVGETVQRAEALPGEQYTGYVMIHNETDSVLTLKIYQDEVSALTSFDQGDQIVTINRSNAGWVTHAAQRMTIRSGEVARVPYEVVVPLRMDTEPPAGTYWSTLTVDVVALGASEFVRPYSRHRLTDIATEITGTGDAGLAINVVNVKGERDSKQLEAVMVNTGDMLVKPQVWFELYDAAGNLKERVEGKADWVFPGGFDRVVADIAHVRPAVYEAQVVVDAGDDNIFGASFTVDMTGVGRVAQSRIIRTSY